MQFTTVYIAADHRGFEMKNSLVQWMQGKHISVIDCGPQSYNRTDDYVEYAAAVSDRVKNTAGSAGILICGSGAGMCIAANKMQSIRSAIGFSVDQVKAFRNDDAVQVLCLASDFLNLEDAQQLIDAFLTTAYESEEHNDRRLRKIELIELRRDSS